jgi:UDPglucose 6-dehydrogenase
MHMASVVMIGSGVVGTATGRGLLDAGHDVTFVDIDPHRIARLIADGCRATDTIDLRGGLRRFVFLTLPTPNVEFAWDLSWFESGVAALGRALRDSTAFHTVVVRSTVPPGTTLGLVQPLLERESGKVAGRDFSIASAPEFLRAASAVEDFKHPWVTVIGSESRRTQERLTDLFSPFGGSLMTYDDPTVPELIKCTHNNFNAVKISFFNEVWLVAQALGVDQEAVASAVALSAEASFNPRYGIRGGAPYGGVCLPKDTKGFVGFAEDLDVELPVLQAAIETNARMESLARQRLEAVGSIDLTGRTGPLAADLPLNMGVASA